MSDIFNIKDNISHNTRHKNCFYSLSNHKTDLYGINSLSYFDPTVWSMMPDDIKNSVSLEVFKSKIKSWKITNCTCKLCRSYVQGLGYA